MQQGGEDDNISKCDPLSDEEGSCEKVCIQYLQSRQEVLLRTLYILEMSRNHISDTVLE